LRDITRTRAVGGFYWTFRRSQFALERAARGFVYRLLRPGVIEMMMLISKAALMRRFRIVETVTILQQTGLRPDRFRNVRRSAG
jgi:hypothetical protein